MVSGYRWRTFPSISQTVNWGHSMSGDPELYIWPWAKSM